jgi:DNA-binding transcriptional MerR regulator
MAAKAVDLLWHAQERKEELEWALAATLASIDASPEWIAREHGFSAAKVRRYIQTYKTFPEPAADVSFELHQICATKTDDPEAWLELAIEHQWTAKELRRRIREAGVPRSELDWLAQGEALIQHLRKFYAEAPKPVRQVIRAKVCDLHREV